MLPTPSARHPAPPMQVVAGLGCRRGCSLDELLDLLTHKLEQHELTLDNLVGLASITHKRDEAGLYGLAQHLNLKLLFFSPEQLAIYQTEAGGSSISQAVTGSPAVAEPCALAAAAHIGTSPHLLGDRARSNKATCALAIFTDTSI